MVSVITVCRNAAATLRACLESVAAQTYPAIEYIVVDGASIDGTASLLEHFRPAIATLISEPDRGIYDAMNKGIGVATGDFVLFINADDFLADSSAIEEAMREIAEAPDGDVFYGSLLVREPTGIVRYDPPAPEHAVVEMVLGCLPHQATFARRAVFSRTGPFDLRWRRHADYDWWLKVLMDPELKVRRITRVVASFLLGGASSDLAKGQPEVFAIQNASPLYNSPEWTRRRLEMFQQAWLNARMEVVRLQSEGGLPLPYNPRHWLISHFPRLLVALLRRAKRPRFERRSV